MIKYDNKDKLISIWLRIKFRSEVTRWFNNSPICATFWSFRHETSRQHIELGN